jgi:hypothetical protein
MARTDQTPEDDKERQEKQGAAEEKKGSVITDLLNKLSISLYGSSRNSNAVDDINDRFNSVIQKQINQITDNGENSLNSFLGKLYKDDRDMRSGLGSDIINDLQLNNTGSNPQDFFTQMNMNKMMRQSMAEELSKQLIELNHAKGIMADTINSADSTTGSISRKIVFENTTLSDSEKNYLPIIEAMEKKFDTLAKIKDFITPNTLGYGEYYVYTVPYYHLFNDFIKRYKTGTNVSGMPVAKFFEAADDDEQDLPNIVFHPIYEEGDTTEPIKKAYQSSYHSKYDNDNKKDKFFLEEELEIVNDVLDLHDKAEETLKDDLTTLFTDRITVTTNDFPIPFLEEGFESYKDFANDYITEDGTFFEEEKSGQMKTDTDDYFLRRYSGIGGGDSEDGFIQNAKGADEEITEADIKDCYIKMIPPTRMIPIKMMNKTLMYVYIQTTPATPLSTILAYTSQVKAKDPNNKMDRLLDDIAGRIVKKFDKSFIKDNMAFKEQIVAALEYYDISNTNIHFQAIPVEYITAYKINVDTDGNGTSMLDNSLFYGNMYMSLFVFKVMTILQKSNDQVVNYVRRSGIDKNLWNDVQDIIRRKNARKITPNDIYSHADLIKKIGAGSEEFVPMTKNGEKPIETEIISGQQVDIDTPFMERIRTNYILSTDVPSAIMNYLNEADFAKSIETANTKMNGAVARHQINLNKGHTDWYRKMLKFSTNVPDEVINTVSFVLPEPKGNNNIMNQELINNYQTLESFLLKLFAGENADDVSDKRKKQFSLDIAKMHLNGINFDKVQELWEKSALADVDDRLKTGDDDESGEMMM